MPDAEPGLTKRDRIAAELRRRILSSEYPRGARLRQDELAHELSSSITPVREALRLLEAEGLLVSEPHKGVRVAGLDLERTKSIYIVRRLIESYAMRRAALRLTPLEIKRAWATVKEMGAALEAQDTLSFRSLNQDFHFSFYERCGIPALHDQIAATWQAFPWDLSLDSIERDAESHQEHLAMLQAVESGDIDAVGRATEEHIKNGFLSLVHRATGSEMDDPFALDT